MSRRATLVATLLLSTLAGHARAATPIELTVQGVLRDGAGSLQTTPVNVTVALFDAATAGNALGSPYMAANVKADNGLFTVTFPAPSLISDVDPATELWAEITMGADTFPRVKVQATLMAQMGGRADDVPQLGGVAAASYLKTSAADTRYLGSAATAADTAKLGGAAAAAFLTTSAGDGRYLGATATAANSAKLGGVAASAYQARVTGTCSGNTYAQSIGATGTVGCGTATAGTVTSVSGTAPVTSSGGAAPALTLGAVPTANGGNRFGGLYTQVGNGVLTCPCSGSGCACSFGNPLNGNQCSCGANYTQTLYKRSVDAVYNNTHCSFQCWAP